MYASYRFDWINGFLTACLHAILTDIGFKISTQTNFEEVNEKYIRTLLDRLKKNVKCPPVGTVSDEELNYLYHLESELWGSDFANYLSFYPKDNLPSTTVLQTFLFPLSFFLLERWVHLFLPQSTPQNYGRPRKRGCLFGVVDGIFTVHYTKCLGALGLPFNLLATTKRVESVGSSGIRWQRFSEVSQPNELRHFYRAVCNKGHFKEIIESSFKRTKTKLPSHVLRPKDRKDLKKIRIIKACWYDVLWIYSESIRYHQSAPPSTSKARPFYWNRSVKWLASLLITGLMCIAHKNNPLCGFDDSWTEEIQKNEVLRNVFKGSRSIMFSTQD